MLDGRPDIILAAYHTRLSRVRDCVPTSETINAIRIKFEFRTEDWNGTEKTAIFVRGQNPIKAKDEDIKPVLLDENNECLVPWEVLNNGKYFSAGVFGTTENYRITSTWMSYRIAPGCCVGGGTVLEPTPTVYDQILEKLQTHNHDDVYYTKYEIEADVKEIHGRIDVLIDKDADKSIREIAKEEADKINAALVAEIKVREECDADFEGRMDAAKGKITALETESAKHAIKTEVEDALALKADKTQVATDIATAKGEVVGTAEDASSVDTVKGAKKLAEELNTAMNTRVEALEAVGHEHENKDVLDGITAEKVAAWDVAEANVQGDWNENDSSVASYIENRPFYETEGVLGDVIYEGTITAEDLEFREGDPEFNLLSYYSNTRELSFDGIGLWSDDQTTNYYQVVCDGIVYDGVVCRNDYRDSIGSNTMMNVDGERKYPFAVWSNGGFAFTTPGPHTIKITHEITPGELKQLDEKFIPDTIVRASTVAALAQTVADNATTANGAVEELAGKVYTKEEVEAQIIEALGDAISLVPKCTTITLPASAWTGSTNPWSQTVTINGVTANSRLELSPTAIQIVALQNYETTLMLQNDAGVVTAWAIGNKPTEDYTMQVLITEVVIV